MIETVIELTEDEFDVRFPLVPNHINPQATWAVGDGPGCLFETFGEEFEFVRRYDRRKVWTLVDGNDGDLYITSGLHFANRVGFLITREPVPVNTFIEVHIPMSDDEAPAP